MSLAQKQDEWSNLLWDDQVAHPLPGSDVFANLSADDRLQVAAIWIGDGIHARHTDHPKSTREIQLLKISRSATLRTLYNICALMQLGSTFLDNSHCDHQYSRNDYSILRDNGAPTRFTLTVFDLLCLVLYMFDLYLVFAVDPSRKSLKTKPWSAFRMFICVFMFIDCLLYFVDPAQPRLMRCVFPFLLISKRNNLKLMCQGLLVSAYKSLPIIKALVCILLLWGFMGFVFFRATDVNNVFSDPGTGIAEALHCFTSRPYVLKALNTIYPNNQASALYFVSLTLAADVLCIALIVATGAKHYKQFAADILHQRLVDRRHAITCAFHAVAIAPVPAENSNDSADAEDGEGVQEGQSTLERDADKRHSHTRSPHSRTEASPQVIDAEWRVSREQWLRLCEKLGGKYATPPHTASFIFDMAVTADPRQLRSQAEEDGYDDGDGGSAKPRTEFLHSVDKYLFFRCCALLAARIVVQVESPVSGAAEQVLRKSLSGPEGRSSAMGVAQRLSSALHGPGRKSGTSGPAGAGVLTIFSPAAESTTGRKSASSGTAASHDTQIGAETEDPQSAGDNEGDEDGDQYDYEVTMVSVNAQLDERTERTANVRVLRVSERASTSAASYATRQSTVNSHPAGGSNSRLSSRLREHVFYQMQPVRDLCVKVAGATVTVTLFSRDHTVNLFYATNIFLIFLLIIDVSFLSQSTKVMSWFAFACVLEVSFWLHLAVRVLAVGLRRFVSFYENRGDAVLNLCSLVALIELGKQYCRADYQYSDSLPMGWYLLFQACRLFKIFFAVNDVRVFEHMRPVLIRATFVFFSFVYFFSIFGYSFFCNALDPYDAQHTNQSNDANQWVQYKNLLNFNTLLQSMFTLFEMSILGNWSIVMDAAVASTDHPASAYIFFYTYRLVITLFVLPILLSFIIQVFLSALNMREREIKKEKEAHIADAQRLADERATFIESHRSKVSYNVNQEVLTLGRRPSGPAQSGVEDTPDEAEGGDVVSPLAPPPPLTPPGSHSPTAGAGGGGGRSRVSIRMGDAATARYAPGKGVETVPGVGGGNSPGRSASPSRDNSPTRPVSQHFPAPRASVSQTATGAGSQHQHQHQQVTVQYDVRAGSSMMSIWTIDGNNPAAAPAAAPPAGGRGGSPRPVSVIRSRSAAPSTASATTAASTLAVADRDSDSDRDRDRDRDREVAELQGRLDMALRLLEAERSRNKALQETAHMI